LLPSSHDSVACFTQSQHTHPQVQVHQVHVSIIQLALHQSELKLLPSSQASFNHNPFGVCLTQSPQYLSPVHQKVQSFGHKSLSTLFPSSQSSFTHNPFGVCLTQSPQ